MGFCGYLRQSTAVDVLLGPFIDDTDGKTAETGLTLDVEISKNGQALANKNDATTPTHDAAGDVDGYYNCELDATDTGTLGIISLVAHAAGFLPVHQTYQVVTAHWYDTMCSTDYLHVDVIQVEGSDATDQINAACDTAMTDYDAPTKAELDSGLAALNDPTAIAIRTEIDTNSTQLAAIVADTNELQVDDVPGLIAALNDPTAAAIADAVWDELATGHTDAGKAGEQLWTDLDAVLADTGELQVDDVPGLIAALNDPTAAAIRTEIDTNSTKLADIVADTNELQVDDVPGLIAALNDITTAQVNAEVADVLKTDTISEMSQGAPTATPTFEEALMYLYMALRNKIDVTAALKEFHNDAGTCIWKKALSDDATTYTEAEGASGP